MPWEVIELKLMDRLNYTPEELDGANLMRCLRYLTVMEYEGKWPSAKSR